MRLFRHFIPRKDNLFNAFVLVIARLMKSAEAISMGKRDCHASLAMTSFYDRKVCSCHCERSEAISGKRFMSKQYYVYVLTNKNNRVLYTGVTNDLKKRGYEHKEKFVNGFTKKYNVSKLVYYEILEDPENAILREKKIKAGSRQKKIDLINNMNKEWADLYWGL
jgi:putative endonuclease